ncbi:hemerythrin domain-containing protein [Actinacidiphila paucisporea]|uniref:Hemerythrin HHE cation binding domain-containing protein n=1 Tax=Actinacidiphila paucisporea TaxID=310782 RepID=A0A1M7Q2W3_9ACTN|nr:hemerythrin domain-containing protein [Actinacidiphila paucisporea]SHN24515.1 Hemerythrin HHE cation binding domain-containing protein [Actinacidiphila paucisporea]
MADTQQDIDFTIMYATHRAFRRDLRRLAAAVEAGQAGTPHVLAGWQNFSHQLHNHHSVEDTALWPQVEAKIQNRPDDLRLMETMEAEHAELGPRIDAVDTALKSGSDELGAKVQDLYEVMDHHFTHEENSALPLIQDVLTVAEWKKFGLANAKNLGVKGVAVYIPWVADGASPQEQREFLGAFPPPVKVVNKLLWERAYRKKGLWKI